MRTALIALPALLALGCGGAPDPAPTPKPVEAPAPAAPEAPVGTAEAGPPTAWESPEALKAACDAALAVAEARRDGIINVKGARTVENTLRAFDDMLLAIDTMGGLEGIAQHMHPDETVRAAGRDCESRIAKFTSDIGLDRGLYEAVAAVSLADADAQTRRMAKHLSRDFRRSGVDKDEPTRTRIAAINAELVKLGQAYSKNLNESTAFIEVDPADLEGLPKDWLDAHKPGENGKVKVSTNYPDFFPFQTYSKASVKRAALYKKFVNRGYPANKEILLNVLKLRAEYVKLLGYDTWAAYQAEDKMVKTAERVATFLQDLVKIVRPQSDADLKTLLARKKKDDKTAKRIEAWDRFYYTGKVREEQYAFDARTVRPYFAYDKVKDGIFALYGELFGLRFEPIKDAPVWHPSVQAYTMYANDEPIGRFFLDMHPRDGKYKHAAMFPLQTGLANGRVPMATLVCNFPDPGKGLALMEHGQVNTFFHEFGHLIHHLLASRADWLSLSGIRVEWDFVETPSQLLEEWAQDHGVLARFAKHHETGEAIPAALVAKMNRAQEFGRGVSVMRQLFYAAYSFFVHNRSPEGLDLDAYSAEIYEKYSPYPQIEGSHIYASFGHLMGYSSQYYTYQWSLVIAKDLFSRFAKAGLLDGKTAMDYRKLILEPGGLRDASDMVKDFLGRDYTLDAYKAWLAQKTPAVSKPAKTVKKKKGAK